MKFIAFILSIIVLAFVMSTVGLWANTYIKGQYYLHATFFRNVIMLLIPVFLIVSSGLVLRFIWQNLK